MSILLRVIFGGTLICMPLLVASQLAEMLQVHHITMQEGLPSNSINDITQDERGIIWMATAKGIVGFDGTTFKSPFPDTLQDLYAYTEFIKILWEGPDVLWAGTAESGLLRWDRKTGELMQFLHDPNDPHSIHSNNITLIFQDPEGHIWIGAGGLCRYQPATKNFMAVLPFRDKVALQKDNGFQHLFFLACEDPSDPERIYLAAAKGICHFNYRTFESQYYFEPDNLTAIQQAYQDSGGHIWTVDWGSGLGRFDIDSKTFVRFRCHERGLDDYHCLNAGGIIPFENNTLLLSIWGGGLMKFNIEQSTFSPVILSGESPCTPIAINTLFRDRNQGIWMTTFQDGVYFSPQRFRVFDRFSVGEIVTDVHYHAADQRVYFCTSVGTVGSCSKSFRDEMVHPIVTSAKFPWLRKLQTDADHNLWLLGLNELYKLKGDLKFHRLSDKAWVDAKRRFGYFWDMVIDPDKHIWISAQNGGLGEWVIATNAFELHQQDLTNPYSLQYEYSIGTLYLDPDGNIWGAGEGIFRFHKTARIFHNLPTAVKTENGGFHTTKDFTTDRSGRIWLGNELDLLFRVHPDSLHTLHFEEIRLKPKLPKSPIHSLLTDQDGVIWITSEAGLTRVDPLNLKSAHYGAEFGLEDLGALTQLPNGGIIIGTNNGLVRFNPAGLDSPQNHSQPYITLFRVMGTPRPISLQTDNISLKQHQNYFSFEFSSLDLNSYSPKYFAYKLDGFDPDWVDAGTRKYVSYTNIRSGHYVFRVRVKNQTGIWSEKEAIVRLTIVPPYYQTIWFWLLVGSVIMIAAYALYRYRIRQIRKEEQLKTAFHKQIAEVEMNALRAQMNPHFLFNSLNAIKYYVVKKSPEKAADYLDNFARLIRLILHHSRESKIPLSQELEALQLYIEMERLRFDEGFDVRVDIDPNLDTDYILIPPLLLQPYVENAIWHGLLHRSDKGRLTLRAYRLNGSIFLEIEDNGIGRHKAAQLKSKSASQKKSMGMQLTKERMDINQILSNTKTTIDIQDLHDEFGHPSGTKVTLTMHHPDTVNS